jgi:ArsR family transcriptional regulator
MSKTGKEFDKEQFFMALADRTRLRILNLIGKDELCVCFFVEILDELQPKISRHLAYLRRAGLVEARRDGKWIHYRLAEPDDPLAARVLDDMMAWLAEDREMQRDREQLVKACCAPQPPVQLQGVPRPASLVA